MPISIEFSCLTNEKNKSLNICQYIDFVFIICYYSYIN